MTSPDKILRWAVISLAFILAAAFLMRQEDCWDIWFHLKAGQVITENRAIPLHEPFSYTPQVPRWHDSHWLFQVLSHAVYRLGGIDALLVLKILFLLAAFLLLFRISYKEENYLISAVLFFLALVLSNERFMLRPEIFTFFFIAAYLYVLNEYRKGGKDYLLLLPIMQVLWVNVHGLFVIGIIVVFVYITGELVSRIIPLSVIEKDKFGIKGARFNKLLLTGGSLVLVSLVNPYGFGSFAYSSLIFRGIGKSAGVWMKSLAELQPPFGGEIGYELALFYLILIGISLASFFTAKVDIANILLYALFLYISFKARRNISLFAFIAFPVTVSNFASSSFPGRISKKLKRLSGAAGRAAAVLVGACLVFYIFSVVSGRYYLEKRYGTRFGTGILALCYPEKAVDFIQENNLPGNVFHTSGAGSYLAWRFYPERKIFLSGMWEVYREDFLSLWENVLVSPRLLAELVAQYDINTVLLTHNAVEIKNLLGAIYADKDWVMVYVDTVASVFVRNTPRNAAIIEKYGIIEPEIPAEELNIPGVNKYPFYSASRARFYELAGLDDKAIREYERAIEIYPGYYEAGNNLGLILVKKGLYNEAAEEFRQCLKMNPSYAKTHNNLGVAYDNLGMYEEAVAEFRTALRLDRNFEQARYNLIVVYKKKGMYKAAMDEWLKFRKRKMKNP